MKEWLFHPHSTTQTTQLACKETHWKGKTAGYSKRVGTKLSEHISFTMCVLIKSRSWFGSNMEAKRRELIENVENVEMRNNFVIHLYAQF